jgi:hypothetical protein
MTELQEYVAGKIWLSSYPIHYAGCDFSARTTYVALKDGGLWVHSPGPLSAELRAQVDRLGPVRHIVAPGSYHYFYVSEWQRAYADAETWLCPGIERKRPELEFDWLLGDRAPQAWDNEFEQVLVRGNRAIWEVVFFHRESQTLIVTDLIENIGDQTQGTNFTLKLWWKAVFHMWNRAKPAPEYQLGWRDKSAAKKSLERILEWDFARIILAHGDLIDVDAKQVARAAWAAPLSYEGR